MTDLTHTQALQRARDFAGGDGRVLLGITGPPGAGKSTLVDALLAELAERARAAPMDGFHLDNQVLADLGRRGRKGAPDTFDVDGYAALLRRLRDRTDEIVYAPRFDRQIETTVAAALPIPRGVQLVIAEGNYLLHDRDGWRELDGLFDEVWYLDVPESERIRRLVQRRMSHGHGEAEAIAWVRDVDQVNAEIIERSKGRADLIVWFDEDQG